jgi:head-tail adaptor
MSIESTIASSGHFISVQRATVARDAVGGRAQTWQTIHEAIPAWVQDMNSRLIATYQQRGLDVSHRIYVNSNLQLREGDRIMFRGRAMIVVSVINAAGIDRLWQIDTQESKNVDALVW